MAHTPRQIAGILLAAGAGSRFGGDKLLHVMPDGVAIAAHAARNLLAAGLEVTAVVRPGDSTLARLLEGEGCTVTVCDEAARGMGRSLAHGVAAQRDAGGWVVALADMPGIRPETIRSVATALEQGALIAAPRRRNRRGHPVGFAAALRDELFALEGDQGARMILERHHDSLKLIECDDSGILHDVDTPLDLAGLAAQPREE
jgi:molybdenum cofactor cytidylyltransferase